MSVHISEDERKRIEKVKKARDKQAKAERKLERERHKKDKLKKLGLGKALVTEDDKALMSNHEVKRAEAKLRNRRVLDPRKKRWPNCKSSTKSYTKEEAPPIATELKEAKRKLAMGSSESLSSSRKAYTTWKMSTKMATKYAKTTTIMMIGECTP